MGVGIWLKLPVSDDDTKLVLVTEGSSIKEMKEAPFHFVLYPSTGPGGFKSKEYPSEELMKEGIQNMLRGN